MAYPTGQTTSLDGEGGVTNPIGQAISHICEKPTNPEGR